MIRFQTGLPVSVQQETFETSTRISFSQSCVSRLEQEFRSFSLMLQDKNFVLSVACFENRARMTVTKKSIELYDLPRSGVECDTVENL